MGTMKTSELAGAALDWAVAKCEELNYRIKEKDNLSKHIVVLQSVTCPDNKPGCCVAHYKVDYYTPSTNWSQGGPIIEREKIDVAYAPENEGEDWYANMYWRGADCVPGYPASETFRCGGDGPTTLIAAMRCYVASKLGDEVEIPEELL